jgi:hypothetical protein
MRKNFPLNEYDAAKTYARELVRATGLDAGILKTREFRMEVYQVSLLPKPENTFGSELLAERVRPGD